MTAEPAGIWPYASPGIPDDLFRRGSCPMTKEEVRAIVLAKARIGPAHTIYDIGAGTGSIAVEAARLARDGHAFAIEREAERAELCRQNAALFDCRNLTVVHGEAPAALDQLPPAGRVIVGGSGGKLREILHLADRKLGPGGRIVITAVSVETLAGALAVLEEMGYEDEVVSVGVARTRKTSGLRMWQALNPITIIAAARKQTAEPRDSAGGG